MAGIKTQILGGKVRSQQALEDKSFVKGGGSFTHSSIEVATTGISPAQGANGSFDFGGVTFLADPPAGKCRYIKHIVISPDKPCHIQWQGGGASSNYGIGAINSGDYFRQRLQAYEKYIIPYDDYEIKYPSGVFLRILESYSANPATDIVKITIATHAKFGNSDRNDMAEVPMLVIGTSIGNGGNVTSGAYYQSNSYPYIIANWLRDNRGLDVWVDNMSQGGSYSSQHESLRKIPYSRYSGLPRIPKIVLYEHGANDVGNGISQAVYTANVIAMCKHKQKFWPDAIMLVFSCLPYSIGLPGSHTTLQSYRTATKAAVLALNDSKCIFVDDTYAWDETNSTQSTANTADGVHPNNTGHNLVAQGVINTWIAKNIIL